MFSFWRHDVEVVVNGIIELILQMDNLKKSKIPKYHFMRFSGCYALKILGCPAGTPLIE